MIARLFYSLRWKLVALFLGSMFLALSTSFGLFLAVWGLKELFGVMLPYRIASELVDMFGLAIILVCGCGFLFVIYIFILSRKTILYLMRITEAVKRIAAGDWNQTIPVLYKDEMGELAANLNKMAAQLKSSIEEERRADRTKNELITNVSHDLRTPLTSITGYLGLIEADRYRDEVELRHYVHIAHEKSKRLHVLIDDLFEYTRLSGGGLKLRLSRLNLVELLAQLAAQCQYETGQAGMEIRFACSVDKIMIDADGDKLARVFENLITNALNYGRDGIYIDLNIRLDEQWIHVEVINYGEPIPPKELPYIFERFYRVEKSRSTDTGGSGLGLAISKQIVELHGGTVQAASDRSKTIFIVRLPRPK